MGVQAMVEMGGGMVGWMIWIIFISENTSLKKNFKK